VGDKVRNFKAGDRVVGGLLLQPTDNAYSSGWGGFSQFTLAGDHLAMIEDETATAENGWFEVCEIQRTVPKDIPVKAALLLCTWREVYAGFGDFKLERGDDIMIFGAGPVGLSFVKFGKLLGLGFVVVVDPLAEKRRKALRMGADLAVAPDDGELENLIRKRNKPFDAIIDAVGSNSIINAALPMVKMAGSVCVYGVIDKPTIQIQKHLAPYNFNLYVHQWPTRFRESAAQKPLCEWVLQGKVDPAEFISGEFPILKINDAVELASSGQALKVLLMFQ